MQDILCRESAKKRKWESWISIFLSPLLKLNLIKYPSSSYHTRQPQHKDTPEGTWVGISANWDHGAAVDMAVGTEQQAECWTHDRELTFVSCFQPLLIYKKL